MATRAWYFLSALMATLLGFTVTAHAANMIDPGDGSLDVAKSLYGALTGGHYAWAGALALVAGVALIRKFGGARWPWVHTDVGAGLLALGGSFGTALAAGLAGGGSVSWPMIDAAGATAFVAMGGYAAVKKILVQPFLVPWMAKAPAPLKALLALVVFWFQHASDVSASPASAAQPRDPQASPASAAPTVH